MAEEKKPAETAKEVKEKKGKKNVAFKKIGSFFKELKSEVSKIVWPSAKTVVNNTVTVLVVAAICSVFIGIIDWIFKTGVALLMELGQ